MNILLPIFFSAATLQFDLPPNLLSSLCYVESTHKVTAVNRKDGDSASLGVCQIKYKTAVWMGFKGSAIDLMNPQVNTYYAAKYLNYQIKRYGCVKRGIIAYNIGNAKGLTNTKYLVKVLKTWEDKNNVL